MSANNKTRGSGFTIVELLIVIVVIAILAAISIVAYNGIQSRGKASAAQSAAGSLAKKLEIYNAINSFYPTTAGTITGTATQNSVTTSATSDWYAAQGSAFTTTAGTGGSATGVFTGLAGPTDPKSVYYTNGSATGGCAWWYDYQNTTWKGISVGTTACPTLPTLQGSSLAATAV